MRAECARLGRNRPFFAVFRNLFVFASNARHYWATVHGRSCTYMTVHDRA